jgi:hypothetical protein
MTTTGSNVLIHPLLRMSKPSSNNHPSSQQQQQQVPTSKMPKTWTSFRSLLLFLTLLPLVVCIFVPLFLMNRVLVLLLNKVFGLIKLTPHDSIFAVDKCYHDNDSKTSSSFASNVTMLFVSDDVKLPELTSKFSEILRKTATFSRLRMKLVRVFGYYFFKEVESVELPFHIRKVKDFDLSSSPEDHERELEEYVGKMMVRPFPNGKPLWEVEVFGKYKGNQSAVVIRIHHSICDGYSFNHLIDNLIGEQSQYRVRDDEDEQQQQHKSDSYYAKTARKIARTVS